MRSYRRNNKKVNEGFGNSFNPANLVSQTGNRYNQGFEYKIVPLSSNLSQKGNDEEMSTKAKELYKDVFYVGMDVQGNSYKDGKEYMGKISALKYSKEENNVIIAVYIQDYETNTIVALKPHTVVDMLKTDMYRRQQNGFPDDWNGIH